MLLPEMLHQFLFDTRLEQKALVNNAYVPFTIITAYVLFTKWIGPLWMQNRPPFRLNALLVLYNFSLSAAYVSITVKMVQQLIDMWEVRCQIYNSKEITVKVLEDRNAGNWHLYLIKFAELLDTIFFVLRKKNNQISFLHVFHHAVVCAVFWFVYRYHLLGYYHLFAVNINNVIHIIMYGYYGLSAMGPRIQKYLWWKKYLTTMQIIQFIIIQAYLTVSFLTGCERLDNMFMTVYIVISIFLILFCKFYWATFKTAKTS